MYLLARIIIYFCFQVLFILTYNHLYQLLFPVLSIISFVLIMARDAGSLNTFHNTSDQKVQVFTPQGEKQINFTDRANGTAVKILQNSLVIYKKKHIHSLKEEESIKEEKSHELSSVHHVPQPVSQNNQVVYLEQLYCMHCLIDQILRSRHCSVCNTCILTYDHHDLIIGKCVGEKNKFFYVIALFFNSLQMVQVVCSSFTVDDVYILGIDIIAILFGIYALSLLCYNCYLIFTNQTSAENRFRDRLNYMKYTKDEYLQPFNQGFIQNWKSFLACSFQKQPYKWIYAQQ